MSWYDIFKLTKFVYTPDPLSKATKTKGVPAGIGDGNVVPDLRSADSLTAGSNAYIRVNNEMIDMTTTTNRINRYKEYDRLIISVPEIDMAMTVFADEACIIGNTLISTVFHGPKSIEWLSKNKTDRFPVYCYNFETEDYDIGWAYEPRFVKNAETVRILLDNGKMEIVTPDHRILKADGKWIQAGDLKNGDLLMPFYKIPANQNQTKLPTNQFPRIYSRRNGWVHERQFIDEWRLGKKLPQYEKPNTVSRLIKLGMTTKEMEKFFKKEIQLISYWVEKEGFSLKELKYLNKRHSNTRRVLGVNSNKKMDVYDLSVENHKNFCTGSLVMHNCQKDEDGHVFKIECEDKTVVKKLEELFFDRNYLNFDQRTMWDKAKRLFTKGDEFWELVIDPNDPKKGILSIQDLPPENMYRIQSVQGRVIEFQQGKEGPDYQAMLRAPVENATESELKQSTAIRFNPEQIVHLTIGDFRQSFYPYGVSLIEPARGPAHQLRMMEDSMVVYRLVRAPERRIFYIDVGTLPSFKAEAFMDRLKDQFRKKKVSNRFSSQQGASAVEEKFHAPSADEDYWLPIRPNSNTRIETLAGAQNLGEIDDTVYFRNKLFTALNFPKNYFSLEDPNATRITLSAQDIKFARVIERLQSHIEEGLYQIAIRHLHLIGYPPEVYEDIKIKMTPPSDWRELSRAEIVTNRINNANSLKGSQLLSDYDILVLWMKYTPDEANEMIIRNKLQKLEDLKLQVLAQNPILLGVGTPGQNEQEIGANPGGPNPMLGQQPPGMPGQEGPPMGQEQPMPGQEGPPPEMPPEEAAKTQPTPKPDNEAKPLPEPDEDEINMYDLEIQSYQLDQDREIPDTTEEA